MAGMFCRSNSYDFNDAERSNLKARLQIGSDYVPVYEKIIENNIENIDENLLLSSPYLNKEELLYIRLAKQGLIISHKPSVNLTLGSLDRNKHCRTAQQHLLPPSKRALCRRDTLRPNCHRSRSDRCRVIKWDRIESFNFFYPKIMIFVLKKQQQMDSNDFGQNSNNNNPFDFCTHNQQGDNCLWSSSTDCESLRIERLCFEFLLIEDMKAFVTSGVFYQFFYRNNFDSSTNVESQSNNQQDCIDATSTSSTSKINAQNLFRRLSRAKVRVINWLNRRASFTTSRN